MERATEDHLTWHHYIHLRGYLSETVSQSRILLAMQSEYDVSTLYQEAHTRWLKPPEVHFILLNHERYRLTDKPPHKPTSGSVLLYNKRVLKFFRKDGHQWKRKKDGRAIAEAHERLKVGNVEALQCYYAHGEHEPSFQRRIYWILDPEYEHIALVHYRDVSDGKEGKHSSGTVVQFSPNPSNLFSSPVSIGTQNASYSHLIGDSTDIHQHHSSTSPGVNSDVVFKSNGVETTPKGSGSSYEFETREALKRLEEQLSLGDDNNVVHNESLDGLQFLDFSTDVDHLVPPLATVHQRPESSSKLGRCYGGYVGGAQYNVSTVGSPLHSLNSLLSLECTEEINAQPAAGHQRAENNRLGRCYGGYIGAEYHSNNLMLVKNDSGKPNLYIIDFRYQFFFSYCFIILHTGGSGGSGDQKAESWKDVLEACEASIALNSEGSTPSSAKGLLTGMQEDSNLSYSNQADQATLLLPQELASSFELPTCYSELGALATNANNSRMELPFEQVMNQTVAYKQKFTIQDISPEWGYANETTKQVIIIGSFLCDTTWSCMFGSTEVPFEIIKEGVIRCQAPPCGPGKVNLCITSGDGLSCSQIKEFEYREKPDDTSCPWSSRDELLLLVRLVQTLVSDSKSNLEPWSHILETILDGTATSSSTVDWLLQELLKDKLDVWLSSRPRQDEDQTSCCSLSKQEQGIIHMVAGLGFEWALHPILARGVGVDFRDINGWSALHWAARFGSEKLVAALIASGASAGAVTDPTAQDPAGKTAASIAASNGHKGLAGYLSEVALTDHLSSLTLEETESSKDTAHLQAEMTLNSISERSPHSLKDTLAAVRNAAQAVARIQAAFRAHSFRKRQQREAAMAAYFQEYGIYADIKGVSAMSKLASGNVKSYHSAALSIQKNYRRYKRRKEFLSLRQKVVKIQAHVRGYQIRKHYKVICWAVGILDKVVLRWRRKGAGLRGFRQDVEDSEEEDILKVFRKQKVDAAVNEAFSRVLSMANSPEARQQYHRVLKRYCQTKINETKCNGTKYWNEYFILVSRLSLGRQTLGEGGDEDEDLFDLADMEDDSLFAL
uniref:CG-1 domain-containing protein n=1 Tax=Brassica oleracea var. oleracea TaxID=109376 RepID=A0A0D3CYL9_BRAOL